MPIYEYQCPKCGRTFEEWVKLSEAHGEEPCPDCGTSSPKLISQTSFVLKGGGWYVTEYGYRKGVNEDGTAAKGAEAGAKNEKSGANQDEKGQTTKANESAKSKDSAKAKAKPKSDSAPSTSKQSAKKTQASPASA